jgi:hypothetical protein
MTDASATDATASEPTAAPSQAPPRQPRWRRFLVGFLVVLSVVLIPLAGLSVWVRNLVLDTGNYVDTVAPLARNTAITDTVADRLTTRLFREVDVEAEAKEVLPERAAFLAGPISSGVETFVREAATRVLASDQFAEVWKQANRRAHDLVVKALTGEGKNVTIKDGDVVLNLSPIIDEVIKRLDERGVTVFDNLAKDQKNLQVKLFDAEQLERARTAVHLLDRARIVLVVLVFVCLGAALALSGNRRRTLIRWGLGVVAAMAIVAALLALGRAIYLDATTGADLPRDAAGAAFDTLVRFLRNGIRVIALLGLIVALAAFLSGPSRVAVRTREAARSLIGGLGRRADEAGWDAGPFGEWVGAHKLALRIAGVALAFVILFYMNRPGPLTLLVLVLLLLVYLAAIEFLGRPRANANGNASESAGAKPTDGTS